MGHGNGIGCNGNCPTIAVESPVFHLSRAILWPLGQSMDLKVFLSDERLVSWLTQHYDLGNLNEMQTLLSRSDSLNATKHRMLSSDDDESDIAALDSSKIEENPDWARLKLEKVLTQD